MNCEIDELFMKQVSFSKQLKEDKIELNLKTVLQNQLQDVKSVRKLLSGVKKLDLDLSYFVDIVQHSQKKFKPHIDSCYPSRLLEDGALFCKIDNKTVPKKAI
jgi:hypothetical protein